VATLTASGQTSSIRATGQIAASTGWRTAWLIVAVVALALVCLGSLMIGSLPISPAATLRALVAPDHSEAAQVVIELRIPRTLLGLAVGAALGVSGALIQALTRNPLADPGNPRGQPWSRWAATAPSPRLSSSRRRGSCR